MTWWTIVRFLHVLTAALWVGGQLALSVAILPPARRLLAAEQRRTVLREVGRRFGIFTGAFLLPVQIITGIAIAWHKGVTWESLAEPGYGRMLAIKLALLVIALACSALHGVADGRGLAGFARAMAITSLVASVGIILFATALPVT